MTSLLSVGWGADEGKGPKHGRKDGRWANSNGALYDCFMGKRDCCDKKVAARCAGNQPGC